MDFLRDLLQQSINGISLGGIYALIALGYTMVYGIIRLINFAHGDILMLGAFFGYFVLTSVGFTPIGVILAFLISMIASAALGFVMEKTCYKPMRTSPRINALITAIGLSLLIENVARALPWIGPNPKPYPTLVAKNLLPNTNINLSNVDLMVLVVSILLMIGLTYIVDYTKTGKAMRAVSFDKGASSLMGINVNGIISFTFMLGSALAAAGGILYAIKYPQIEPYMGIMPGLKAFVAAVLGGIGSIPGAMIGGFIMGIAETFTKGFISSQLADAIAFGILIIILLIKPAGIMGKNIREKV